MNFGLDWDGTCEEDLDLWRMFVMLAQRAGHKVYIVTMRYPSERLKQGSEITDEWMDMVDGVIFTSRKGKKPYCLGLGIHIDVWIDDNPLAVEYDAKRVFGVETPEGVVVAKTQDLPAEYRQQALAMDGFSIIVRYVVPPGCEDVISGKVGIARNIEDITGIGFVNDFTKMPRFAGFSIHHAPMGNFLMAEVNSRSGCEDRIVAEIEGCSIGMLLKHFRAWQSSRNQIALEQMTA